MTTTELRDKIETIVADAIALGATDLFHLTPQRRKEVLKEIADNFNVIADAIDNNQITFVDNKN